MDPKFSILVPTRQRPETLLATLATLVWQGGDDYEIVVADNCGDQEVAAVIGAVQQRHNCVKHIRSDRVLPMAENWERGLAACSGEYVSVLGDDDAFLPSTLAVVRQLVSLTNARLIAWELHTYWWPDTIVHWNRNRLYLSLSEATIGWIESRRALVETYRNPTSFAALPMIYSGFVHREIINAVIDRFGGYFVPVEMSPDITSGIINLAYTNRYVYSYRPLAIRGNSRSSTGSSFWARSLGKEQQALYYKQEGRTAADLAHPLMVPTRNIAHGVASHKLFLKDMLFPHDNELQIDLPAVVKFAIANLNSDPDAYDDNLAETLQLAEKIGFVVDPSTIPPKAPANYKALQGLMISGSSVSIGVNCDMANVFDIAGAARLAQAMSADVVLRGAEPAVVTEAARKAS